ncbi:MAG TPA: RHS repeat-associated core domain-containing protein, partial [Pyrinomonadaceae bacterium]|nr:RHS repeat-associated core domain-containing protein [Pyrinomonadaceae bacterium]
RHNSTVIWSGNINGYGNQATFSLSATLAAGDTLDFQVGYGSNQTYNSDSTGLAATITQSGASSPTNVKWLLTDHLGTPRMIVAQTGALANIKRHDYLPFGEELFAPAGGRTSGWGYSSGNGIRQQFTQKERDSETGLDYFLARYYSSTQGRFTSPDEFTGGPDELYYFVEDASANPTFYADLRKPQSLNKYQYAYNNPLRWIDPDGHDPEEPEPQDPKPVVPVPVPIAPGMPPVPVTISPGTPGPSDQQIIEGAKSVLDTVADYTGITWIADKIRPFCPFCPKPTPAPAQPTTAAQPSPTTGTPPQTIAQPQARPEPVQSRGRGRGRSRGRGNQKDTGLRDKSDADVAKGARDRSLPKAERQRYKKEEKARGERNRKKREDK